KENTLEHHINDIANQLLFDDDKYSQYNSGQHLRDQSKIKQHKVDYDTVASFLKNKKEHGEKYTESKEPNIIMKSAYACGRFIVYCCKWILSWFGWKPNSPIEGKTKDTTVLKPPPGKWNEGSTKSSEHSLVEGSRSQNSISK